jgi:hypothetical protein
LILFLFILTCFKGGGDISRVVPTSALTDGGVAVTETSQRAEWVRLMDAEESGFRSVASSALHVLFTLALARSRVATRLVVQTASHQAIAGPEKKKKQTNK